ncbi:hypothetical protein KUTeg_019255 [Tegillarca granosa]|uniref:DDE Tnp4 domain-containing protein n=1 Tax=Tegillarca granosa TaxID=220873 RepID=A0ABQ9EBZ8_TEGGR|nr:hypothetical protein KUTeg_019255 [Tegillarca granosa]
MYLLLGIIPIWPHRDKIAQHRIHVERVIKKIRTYKIISNCFATKMFASVNKLWTVCSLLTLWQNPVLKVKEICSAK